MIKKAIVAALFGGLVCTAALAQDAPVPDSARQNSVKLVTVLMALPAGTPWLGIRTGLFCNIAPFDKTWDGSRQAQDLPPYADAFKTALEAAGFKVVTPGETNLFEESAEGADYEAAAVIKDARIDVCLRRSSPLTRLGDALSGEAHSLNEAKGEGSMTIDWQVYSRLKKQVVARISTQGHAKLDDSVPGGTQRLIVQSFADNARALAQNADFRAAMNAPKAFTAGFQMPGQQSPIVLSGSLQAGPHKIADATGSVVTILDSTGSGSGFLVSTDGYVLTDAHVVGDDKTVRVRWSDGLVTLATVKRVSKNRDVAIIKTNPRDRAPLALKRGPVTPGQRVYAIGSPNGKDFEGTVSSGVISADRVIDGLRYIQSDTAISPGSSGGPLLDESGSVIGISEMTYFNGGKTASLNMFNPIGDTMDFLALEQK
jgi:serine protease Do